ncbi:MAG: sensor histidine kinase N-terminal domain-containing protein [Cypionkella sp.]|nr:sensor histidine kinase N-terminal domain-containing protein [Cypionkella sp.]
MSGDLAAIPQGYSLRRRLLGWLFLATAVIGIFALIDTWREALRTAQTVSDRVLFGSALAIAERVSLDETGVLEVDIPYSSLEMLSSTAQDRVFYRIDGPQGAFLSGYADLPVQTPPLGEMIFSDGQYSGESFRSVTLARAISTGARRMEFRVTVAETTRARRALARQILLRAGLRLGGIALAVAVIVWAAVTLAFRPLQQLSAAIALRSPADLRAVTLQAPQEVGALIDATNGFMGRLETALSALRHFTGNASHQLRTPLSVVRTQLALAERSTSPASESLAFEQAKSALTRAERVLAQLLVLARVDATQSAAAIAPMDVAEAARQITAEMVPVALQSGIDLGYEGPDRAIAIAEPVLLGELLKNLLDNAMAYAGQRAIVTVRLRSAGADKMVLEVEDNGPGLAGAIVPQRGQNLLPSAQGQSGSAGYGLGLAICAEIAALFGGALHLGAGAGGQGLRVEISLISHG